MPPLEDKVNVFPVHFGLLLLAEGIGVAFTVTAADVVAVQPPVPVTVSVYVPVAEIVAEETEGVADVEVKLLGPLQL